MKYNIIALLMGIFLLVSSSSCTGGKKVSVQANPAPEVLEHNWCLVGIDGSLIDVKEGEAPTLEVDLTEQRISGYNGCNRYFGSIFRLDSGVLELAPLASTRMGCPEGSFELAFMERMEQVRRFSLDEEGRLNLVSEEGTALLTFVRAVVLEGEPDARLATNDDSYWEVTHILGAPIEGGHPYLMLDLLERQASGYDSCNHFSGLISRLTGKALQLELATTLRMCPDMKTADAFRSAISRVRTYEIEGKELHLMDEGGTELLRLRSEPIQIADC